MASLDFRTRFGIRFQCFFKRPAVTRTVFPLFSSPSYQFSSFSISLVLQTSFFVALDFFFCFLELSRLSRRTILGGFYHSISLGVVSRVPFPSLVRLSSSSPVYLYLFWSSWVPSGRCLSLLSHIFCWNFVFLSFICLPLHLPNHVYFLWT